MLPLVVIRSLSLSLLYLPQPSPDFFSRNIFHVPFFPFYSRFFSFSIGFSWLSKVVEILLSSLFHFLFFHQNLTSFTLDYSYLLNILALSVSLLCYFEHLIFPSFISSFSYSSSFVLFLAFSLSLLFCSFVGQLASHATISDGIPCPFNFFLILQLLLDFLVPPPRFPCTCRANFFDVSPSSLLIMLRIISAILCQSSCPPSIPLSITSILNLLFTF